MFVLHPHQNEFVVPRPRRRSVPDNVPPQRAVLAANMETALNAVWDGAPGPADRIAVVGGGVVGLLVARLCARMPGTNVTVVDVSAGARGAGARRSAPASRRPTTAPENCDVVFHASASAAGLATALRIAGEEAAVVELSWYGAGDVAAPLGEAFHSRRLRLISSQVGKVAASHRPRWTYHQRLSAALALLDDPRARCADRAAGRLRGPAGAPAGAPGGRCGRTLPAYPLSSGVAKKANGGVPCTRLKSPTRS